MARRGPTGPDTAREGGDVLGEAVEVRRQRADKLGAIGVLSDSGDIMIETERTVEDIRAAALRSVDRFASLVIDNLFVGHAESSVYLDNARAVAVRDRLQATLSGKQSAFDSYEAAFGAAGPAGEVARNELKKLLGQVGTAEGKAETAAAAMKRSEAEIRGIFGKSTDLIHLFGRAIYDVIAGIFANEINAQIILNEGEDGMPGVNGPVMLDKLIEKETAYIRSLNDSLQPLVEGFVRDIQTAIAEYVNDCRVRCETDENASYGEPEEKIRSRINDLKVDLQEKVGEILGVETVRLNAGDDASNFVRRLRMVARAEGDVDAAFADLNLAVGVAIGKYLDDLKGDGFGGERASAVASAIPKNALPWNFKSHVVAGEMREPSAPELTDGVEFDRTVKELFTAICSVLRKFLEEDGLRSETFLAMRLGGSDNPRRIPAGVMDRLGDPDGMLDSLDKNSNVLKAAASALNKAEAKLRAAAGDGSVDHNVLLRDCAAKKLDFVRVAYLLAFGEGVFGDADDRVKHVDPLDEPFFARLVEALEGSMGEELAEVAPVMAEQLAELQSRFAELALQVAGLKETLERRGGLSKKAGDEEELPGPVPLPAPRRQPAPVAGPTAGDDVDSSTTKFSRVCPAAPVVEADGGGDEEVTAGGSPVVSSVAATVEPEQPASAPAAKKRLVTLPRVGLLALASVVGGAAWLCAGRPGCAENSRSGDAADVDGDAQGGSGGSLETENVRIIQVEANNIDSSQVQAIVDGKFDVKSMLNPGDDVALIWHCVDGNVSRQGAPIVVNDTLAIVDANDQSLTYTVSGGGELNANFQEPLSASCAAGDDTWKIGAVDFVE